MSERAPGRPGPLAERHRRCVLAVALLAALLVGFKPVAIARPACTRGALSGGAAQGEVLVDTRSISARRRRAARRATL